MQKTNNSACFQDGELGDWGEHKWEGHLLLILQFFKYFAWILQMYSLFIIINKNT